MVVGGEGGRQWCFLLSRLGGHDSGADAEVLTAQDIDIRETATYGVGSAVLVARLVPLLLWTQGVTELASKPVAACLPPIPPYASKIRRLLHESTLTLHFPNHPQGLTAHYTQVDIVSR